MFSGGRVMALGPRSVCVGRSGGVCRALVEKRERKKITISTGQILFYSLFLPHINLNGSVFLSLSLSLDSVHNEFHINNTLSQDFAFLPKQIGFVQGLMLNMRNGQE